MSTMYKCKNCGEVFSESEIYFKDELTGEAWGQPAYEKWAYCPYCMDTGFEEYYPDDEEDEEDV